VPAGAFDASAVSFDNADFVDTVVHSYRHRYQLAPGDALLDASEHTLALQQPITVPAVVIDALDDPIGPPIAVEAHRERFPGLVEFRTVHTGHNAPQEDPAGFADAVLALHRASGAAVRR
jgi:pimeloyl-ACP methyl ester carboxylesterase